MPGNGIADPELDDVYETMGYVLSGQTGSPERTLTVIAEAIRTIARKLDKGAQEQR